jgi:hypothetical protein
MRQKDGIVCLVHPLIRRYCKLAGSSDYHLSVAVHGHRMHSVYFPPSFPLIDFAKTFKLFGGSGTVIGDINTRFGKTFNDTTSGPRDRMEVIQHWLDRWLWQHYLPETGTTRVHCTSAKGGFIVLPAPIATDHPLILAKLDIQRRLTTTNTNKPVTRKEGFGSDVWNTTKLSSVSRTNLKRTKRKNSASSCRARRFSSSSIKDLPR